MTLAFIILFILSAAFVFAVMFGKPSKDEPMEETTGQLEDFETFWHKKENV